MQANELYNLNRLCNGRSKEAKEQKERWMLWWW